MKNVVLSIAGFAVCFSLHAQKDIQGKIIDKSTKEALVGVTVQVLNSYQATSSDKSGNFQFNHLKKEAILKFSSIGYENDTLKLNSGNTTELKIELQAKNYQSEEVIISATRVNQNVPAAVTTLNKKEIAANNLGKDIPYLLQLTPSLVNTSDGGSGIGYTGLRIRGSDASRINVTMNGIPLNDAESHSLYWVNMPDLASSLESIQIQRGVGTSTNGAASFGASINMESTALNPEGYGEINNSYGSFNSRKHTVKVGSGIINDHFVFEGRLSQINSDGYIDRANVKLQSYYLSGAYYGKKTVIKGLTFGGKEKTYQSWNGTPEARFKNEVDGMNDHASNEGLTAEEKENLLTSGRTYNYYTYKNQIDNYLQNHYQLHFSHEFSKKLTANLSLHYTKGEGYYEEFKADQDLTDYRLDSVFLGNDTINSTDLIRQRWLDNDFYGFTFAILYNPNQKLNFNLGGGLNQYVGDHFGKIVWAEYASNSFPTDNYYFNKGKKTDGNIYLKSNFQLTNKIKLFADLQLRSIQYAVEGKDNDQRELSVDQDFLFFNPKLGANWQINSNNNAYLTLAMSNHEPNRSDFTDLPPNTPPADASKAERMLDIEAGYEYRRNKYFVGANFFFMNYDNQLVNTGHINDTGDPVRQNVDKSYRTGIEFQAAYQPIEALNISLSASLSQNKILDFKEYIYDYGTGAEVPFEHGETDIAFSPEIIASNKISYIAFKGFEIAFISRYVGAQFLDNTSDNNRMLDAYFLNDLNINYQLPTKLLKSASIQLSINNLFSTNYASNGYTYSYIYGSKITENFYFPQAFRNYMLSLNLKF